MRDSNFTLAAALAAFGILGVLSPLSASAGTPPSAAAATGASKVFLTMDEALQLAFPDLTIERDKQFLSAEECERAAELAGSELESAIAYTYTALRDGEVVGTAYFDAHRVRTLRETIMVVVAPDETVQRLEILAFAEPLDYMPRGEWYGQFLGKRLDEDLSLKRGIRGITGATLSAQATTRAARRILALHRVLQERTPTPPPTPAPGIPR